MVLSVLAVPVLLFPLFTMATHWGYIFPSKPFLEPASLVVLYIGFFLCLLRYRSGREPFFLWLSFLTAGFIWREHHLVGSKYGVFVIFGACVLLAWRHYGAFRAQLGRTSVMSLLIAAIECYYIAWGIDKRDRRWWVEWMPGDKHTVWSPVEEAMEMSGHLALVLAIFVVAWPWVRSRKVGEESPEASK